MPENLTPTQSTADVPLSEKEQPVGSGNDSALSPPPQQQQQQFVHEDTTAVEQKLTTLERRNVWFMLLAYAFLVSSTTLVVGSSGLIVLAVGGSRQIAPIALAVFLAGASVISLGTAPIFARGGRKGGFMVGISGGLLGAAIGAIGIWLTSPVLIIIAMFPLGVANGIGMYLRFAAIEVVPAHAKAFAVTLVLTGGCLAAFVGPESSEGTKNMFGSDLTYFGNFLSVAVFNVVQATFVALTVFPKSDKDSAKGSVTVDVEKDAPASVSDDPELPSGPSLPTLMMRRSFWVPTFVSAMAWSIMAMPMSVVRVAMGQLGFSSRTSLLVIELHFLGMYAPGFVTSKLITRFGPQKVIMAGMGAFLLSLVLSLLADEGQSLVLWALGQIMVGIGWNLTFSSSTVMLPKVYAEAPAMKGKVQSAHDFIMFLVSGGFNFATGYIYEAGGSAVPGWRTVLWSSGGLVVLLAAVMTYDLISGENTSNDNDNKNGKESYTPAKPTNFEDE